MTFHLATIEVAGPTYRQGPDGMGAVVLEVPGTDFPIRLYQHGKRSAHSFAVQYGQQVDAKLSYAEACQKMGEAMLHDAACRFLIDNERD